MPNIQPADPFCGKCQVCGRDIAEGGKYYTPVIENKHKHICQKCYDLFEDEGRIDPKDPLIFSPNK